MTIVLLIGGLLIMNEVKEPIYVDSTIHQCTGRKFRSENCIKRLNRGRENREHEIFDRTL
jgi:hypothetical protein